MDTAAGHRRQLVEGLGQFARAVGSMADVRRIAVLGSIATDKADPKDIDVLVVVADDADLAPLATASRRLQGHAQSVNRGADVFLADERGAYNRANVSLEGLSTWRAAVMRCPSLRTSAISSRRSRG